MDGTARSTEPQKGAEDFDAMMADLHQEGVFDRKESGEDAQEATETRDNVENVLSAEQSGIPAPPEFNRQPTGTPPVPLSRGIPASKSTPKEPAVPLGAVADDGTLRESRTIQIVPGQKKPISPQEQLAADAEAIAKLYPVGSAIIVDSNRKNPKYGEVSYAIVEGVSQNESTGEVFVRVTRWVSPEENEGKPGVKKGANYDAKRILELNKSVPQKNLGLVKDPGNLVEAFEVLSKLGEPESAEG